MSATARALVGRRAATACALALIAGGAATRLLRFATPRTLVHDEAALAVNILERGYAGLLAPLDHDQGAPLGFLWAVKASSQLFGESEAALRLVPLLAGLASLPAVWWLARRLAGEAAALVALALTAFSYRIVEYDLMLKPYVTDFLVTCGVGLAASAARDRRGLLRLALVGAVAVWLSYPVVFVLAGVGIGLAWTPLRERRWPELRPLLGLGALWVASFALNLLAFSASLLGSDFMHRFWSDAGAFMPLPPTSLREIEWFRDAYLLLFNSPVGLGHEMIGAIAYPVGLVALAARCRALPWALALPLALALLASGFALYPFKTRLLMFAAPLLVIPIGAALVALVAAPLRTTRVAGVVMALFVAQPLVMLGVRSFAQPVASPASDAVIAEIAARAEAGDWVVCNEGAWPIYRYYARRHEPGAPPISPIPSSFWNEALVDGAFDAALAGGARRIWVLHAEFDELPTMLAAADARGTRVESFPGPEASAHLYRVKGL